MDHLTVATAALSNWVTASFIEPVPKPLLRRGTVVSTRAWIDCKGRRRFISSDAAFTLSGRSQDHVGRPAGESEYGRVLLQARWQQARSVSAGNCRSRPLANSPDTASPPGTFVLECWRKRVHETRHADGRIVIAQDIHSSLGGHVAEHSIIDHRNSPLSAKHQRLVGAFRLPAPALMHQQAFRSTGGKALAGSAADDGRRIRD